MACSRALGPVTCHDGIRGGCEGDGQKQNSAQPYGARPREVCMVLEYSSTRVPSEVAPTRTGRLLGSRLPRRCPTAGRQNAMVTGLDLDAHVPQSVRCRVERDTNGGIGQRQRQGGGGGVHERVRVVAGGVAVPERPAIGDPGRWCVRRAMTSPLAHWVLSGP